MGAAPRSLDAGAARIADCILTLGGFLRGGGNALRHGRIAGLF